jgi:hypothetical protein
LTWNLEFFVHGVEHWRDRDAGGLDADYFPAWSLQDALDFRETRCGLIGRLPGFVVEHYGELFYRWRDAIDAGRLRAPFHVTHVDAHADLGLGDAGYVHLMTDLVWRRPDERREPGEHVADGNYLAFAIGCRWLSGLDYVFNRDDRDGEGAGDLMPYLFPGFRPGADYIEIATVTRSQIDDLLSFQKPEPQRVEPPVPFRAMGWREFTAVAPFDMVCLARSPEYTPVTCDVLFDAVRERFIDELTPAG